MDRSRGDSRGNRKWRVLGWMFLLAVAIAAVGLAIYYLTPLSDEEDQKTDKGVKTVVAKSEGSLRSDVQKTPNVDLVAPKGPGLVENQSSEDSVEQNKVKSVEDDSNDKDLHKQLQNILKRDVNVNVDKETSQSGESKVESNVEETKVEPTPVETKVEEKVVDTSPVEPTPVEPTPVETTPVQPKVVEPSPVEPSPVETKVEEKVVESPSENKTPEFGPKEEPTVVNPERVDVQVQEQPQVVNAEEVNVVKEQDTPKDVVNAEEVNVVKEQDTPKVEVVENPTKPENVNPVQPEAMPKDQPVEVKEEKRDNKKVENVVNEGKSVNVGKKKQNKNKKGKSRGRY